MAAIKAHVDFTIVDREWTDDPAQGYALRRIQRIQGPVPQTGGYQALNQVEERECQARCPEELLPPPQTSEFSWEHFFSNRRLLWGNTGSQSTRRQRDFRHKESRIAAWQSNRRRLGEGNAQLAIWDGATVTRISGPASNPVQGLAAFAAHEGHLDLTLCHEVLDNGQIDDAVNWVTSLVHQGANVPNRIFYGLLKRCIADKNLVLGRHIHALLVKCGYEGDDFLATHLIGMYASHGGLEEATRVFTRVFTPSAYTWATIIFAHARNGEGHQAIRLYRQMRQSNVKPDNHIYSAVLKACASVRDLGGGKEVHAHILASTEKPDIFVYTGLVDMYAKCGSLDTARNVFNKLAKKSMVTWNAMLAGYVQEEMGQQALDLYSTMQQEGLSQPDRVTFLCVLQACACVGKEALCEGKKLHALILERRLQNDLVLGGSLVNMYAKCGCLSYARTVFDQLPHSDVVTWNVMFAGYVQNGMCQEALYLYSRMRQEGIPAPTSVTFVCLLQACAGIGSLLEGKRLHGEIIEQGLQDDVVVGCSLVNMYSKCGSLKNARLIFDKLPEKNVTTWNAMVAGYAQQGTGQEALSVYESMLEEGNSSPDSVTFVSLLQSCASVGVTCLDHGKQIHAKIQERGLQDVVLGCSLVHMYAKCGSLEDARIVFDNLVDRDVAIWNAMIAAYAQEGMLQEAFSLYYRMQSECLLLPDSATFTCLLQACANVAALLLGKQLHAQIEEQSLQADVVVGGALVNMYAKCGSMSDSQQVFDSLAERNVEAWGALIGGYSRHGDSDVVFQLLDQMKLEGIQPTDVILLSVLTVCSHVGLLEKGRKYFEVMETEYGVTPGVEHYTCIMDLLGRAGHLDEALQIAKTMPLPPDDAVWATLLGACRKWSNVEIGKQAFDCAVRLDAKNAAFYSLMFNIYAKAQMWEDAKEMQARRVKCGAWKERGQSWWTDMGGVVHTFVAGDKMHPESEGIYRRLEQLVTP